jgi:hypothetical protein
MTPRWVLVSLTLAGLIIAVAWYWSGGIACSDASVVSVSTDRTAYTVGETVHITIRNNGSRPADIYCPSWCALGNFPTAVERRVAGRWEYFAGFCPSIGSPFENRGTPEGDFIRHSLVPGASFEVGIGNLDAFRLEGEEDFRIVYYVCGGREPVYSGGFSLRP